MRRFLIVVEKDHLPRSPSPRRRPSTSTWRPRPMPPLIGAPPTARAESVSFQDDALVVRLKDGRSLGVPLAWFPRLRDATPAQRVKWELSGHGTGIHWPELDEDVSVAGLLGVPD